jgi:ABC-type Fe3+-hydroxamate transport system substrate-binding protein
MRVVSLVPSVTETLLAWGIRPVACTRFCEQPGLATVGGTKNPDLDAITRLAPDLVVMDEEENRREAYETLRARGLDVLALAVRGLADVDPAMARLAERTGADWVPLGIGGTPASAVIEAFVPIWRRPYMALGAPTYGTSVLALLSVGNVAAGLGPYPTVTLEQMRAAGARLVLVPSEPYSWRENHLRELSAVGSVVPIDGKDLFWWGARTPGALERLGIALSPDRLARAAAS